MKFTLAAFALAVVGATAQKTTVSAPCGTSCPTTIPDKMITRTMPMMTESTPCPSLLVSTFAPNGSNPNPMATGTAPMPSAFTGGAAHVAGSFGAVAAAVAAVIAL